MVTYEQALDDIYHCKVVVDIGQLGNETKRELEKLARKDRIKKWRGYWFPIAGAPEGIGALKTCYGIPPIYEAAKRAGPAARAEFNRIIAADNKMRAMRGEKPNSPLWASVDERASQEPTTICFQ